MIGFIYFLSGVYFSFDIIFILLILAHFIRFIDSKTQIKITTAVTDLICCSFAVNVIAALTAVEDVVVLEGVEGLDVVSIWVILIVGRKTLELELKLRIFIT